MKILAALVLQRNTCTLCWPFEACTLKTEPSISRWQLSTSFEDTMAIYHSPDLAGRVEILAALLRQKKHMHWCLKEPFENLAALVQQKNKGEVHEGPNTQDRAEHLTAETGHHLEGVIATCHLLGISEQGAGNSSNTQCSF